MKKLNNVKIFLTDCDGVLTDGGMYYFNSGDEAKKFNTRDGMGFKILKSKNILTGIITGEKNSIVDNRAKKLKVDILYMGVEDKLKVLEEICNTYNVTYDQIVYVGDDINDLPIIKTIKNSFAPVDAHVSVCESVSYVCSTHGGDGVIREIVDQFF